MAGGKGQEKCAPQPPPPPRKFGYTEGRRRSRLARMSDPLALFPRFCARLKIASKDYGEVPLRLNGCQREWVRQVRKAISEDRRWIVTLKGRQQGMSTITLALSLFWPAKYANIQGGVITESDDNKEKFRTTLQRYHD